MNSSSATPALAASPAPDQSPSLSSVTAATAARTSTVMANAPGLFRKIDWLTLALSFLAVWIGYFLTLAPEVTLEDSGELATGSYYAGIPHPPGYPVWTIYTWLWTVLVPFKNVAWRVALGEATGGAFAAGLLGMLVSRGSSLLIESIDELKGFTGKRENLLCLISGFCAALLMGFNGFMWSQSVIVEVYSFSVASLMLVLVCLLRWIYQPSQHRYLYLALFFHGLCFTNHQTLVVAAIGIEVAIAAAHRRMGRYLWLGNSIIYVAGLLLKQQHVLTALENNVAIFVIFNVVGVASLVAYGLFARLTRETPLEFGLDVSLALFFITLPLVGVLGPGYLAITIPALAALIYFSKATSRFGWEWLVIIACGVFWLLGAAFYFYMPLAGMTNPPMEWGYPRTVEGFIHAFTRGQYDRANPSDVIHHPLVFLTQLGMLGSGIIEEFNWVYAFIALLPFGFFFKLRQRERAWLIGLGAIYLCLGVLLLILLNPPADRAAQSLVRVFFTASHTVIALLAGYGLSLIAAWMVTHYRNFRSWGLLGGGIAIGLALLSLVESTEQTYFGQSATIQLPVLIRFIGQVFSDPYQYGLPVWAGLLLVGMTTAFVIALLLSKNKAPWSLTLALFALMPLHSILTHWSDNEQRGHWFGYWFGHDMFTPPFKAADAAPLYPIMPKDSVVFGGTDPGRFCPTYMIFCDSFVGARNLPKEDPEFDRRDCYLITQNALADGTYLEYIRAQYNRSAQIDPPFFQELLRPMTERTNNYTNVLARAVRPLDHFFTDLGDKVEMRRRTFTSWFKQSDFLDLKGLASRLRSTESQDPVSKFVTGTLSADTRKLLETDPTNKQLAQNLAHDLNVLLERELKDKTAAPVYEPARFSGVALSKELQEFIAQNPRSHTRIRLNRLLLEAAYAGQIARSLGGVYPDREIITPSNADLMHCQDEYIQDAGRRSLANQLKPGENVRVEADGRISISGQLAVMGINGLIAKTIFDRNPTHEFFVEESFPLDWMYPYLTPYGIIMKINREPLPQLPEKVLQTDHEFWSQYSERLIGNWINYDTSVKEITDWIQRVYLRRNFRGFTGDRRFIRDDQAQKSFSKLRSAIAGVYLWRLRQCKEGTPEYKQLAREVDFAFRQALAFCPYSPEAVFRYITLFLVPEQRIDDAILVATSCQKLDPFNSGVNDLLTQLLAFQRQQGKVDTSQAQRALQNNPNDIQAIFNLAGLYAQSGRTAQALEVLDKVLTNAQADPSAIEALVQGYISLKQPAKLQQAVDRLAQLASNRPTVDPTAASILAEGYLQLQNPNLAVEWLDRSLAQPNLDAAGLSQLARQYAAIGNLPKLEVALERLPKLAPDIPEAWYDLAGIKAVLGKQPEALNALRQALTLSASRLRKDPKALNLLQALQTDRRFDSLRTNQEFKNLANP